MGMFDNNEIAVAMLDGSLDAKRRLTSIECDFAERLGNAQCRAADIAALQAAYSFRRQAIKDGDEEAVLISQQLLEAAKQDAGIKSAVS
nr:MAG TPA: hypothetical protein [Caudoviricetes sp.]